MRLLTKIAELRDMSLFRKIQGGVLGFLFLVAIAALVVYPEAKIRAPLLTMTGGAMILIPLVPAGKPELPQFATMLGTLVALCGGWYWVSEATGGKPGTTLAEAIIFAIGLVVVGLLVAGFFRFTSSSASQENPDMLRRQRRVGKVGKQLRNLVRETTSVPSVYSNGTRYAEYDPDINMLFVNSWSMVGRRYQTTYAWREHENLIENYLVRRLQLTAEIAITKHPHQCKYGEVAQIMADELRSKMTVVNIITGLDPLPDNCPECREAKPTHRVNCMAAICWRCKYPTPPSKHGGENTAVITPQCHIPQLCFPRGEQLAAGAPLLRRIRLPFTIPQNSRDECLSRGEWPRNRRELRDLLEQLQHEEDAVS